MFLVTHTDSFFTAEENMRFDDALLANLDSGLISYFFRQYDWQQKSITHPRSVVVPEPLLLLDHACRSTGGGIVFHCPGDTVFSMGFLLSDPRLPLRFKEKLGVISQWFGERLREEGFETETRSDHVAISNRNYCLAYPNPFERYYNGQKAVAFAMKRSKDRVMVQGVIHRHASLSHFQGLTDTFGDFFTLGLGSL